MPPQDRCNLEDWLSELGTPSEHSNVVRETAKMLETWIVMGNTGVSEDNVKLKSCTRVGSKDARTQ